MKDRNNPILLSYVPHGLDDKIFFPLEEFDKDLLEFKTSLFGKKEYDFILLFNSRNIRRKNIPNTIMAWKQFLDLLPKEKREKCLLLLHTQPVDDNGTDLPALIEYLFPEGDSQISILANQLPPQQMNYLYNLSDGVVLLSTAEGWGLSLTEAMLTGKPFIATVTGGMQDQMRFQDENGDWFTPNPQLPSNHKGTLSEYGEWAFPIFPTSLSIVGSVPTPYIYDAYTSIESAASQISNLYDANNRKEIGEAGRKWATSDEAGFTSEKMGKRIIKNMEKLFKTWKPREEFEFLKDTDYQPRHINHNLNY